MISTVDSASSKVLKMSKTGKSLGDLCPVYKKLGYVLFPGNEG